MLNKRWRSIAVVTVIAVLMTAALAGCQTEEQPATTEEPAETGGTGWSGQGQIARLGWLADYPIMDNFLFPLFYSESGDNKAFYKNPEVDALILEARGTLDLDERIAKYREVEKMIGEDMPLIAVVNYRHLRVGSDRVRDFVFNSVGLGSFDSAWIAPDANATAPVAGGRMSFYISEPAFIDPYNGQESEGMQVINMLYDGLVDVDLKTLEVVPAVAESWTVNDDATVYTFKLRQGTKFHDGTEVKAGDFKYAWSRVLTAEDKVIDYHLYPIKGAEAFASGDATELEGVKVVDDYTLEVTLEYPFADFLYVLGHPSLGPVPQAAVDADPKAFLDKPIGNGPFKMAEPWSHEQYIKVDRFDEYYGDKPYLDGVDYKIFKDEETAFAEFEAGNLDFTTIPTGRINDVKAKYGESTDGYTLTPGKQALFGSELSTYYLWFNTKDEFMGNADLRKAISLAVNRQAIADTVYEGTRVPATGPVPEGILGYQKDAWEFNRYDLELAKEYLDKAGYPEGEGLPEIKLSFNSGVGHEDVMAIVQADLAKIGVTATFDPHEWAEYSGTFLNN